LIVIGTNDVGEDFFELSIRSVFELSQDDDDDDEEEEQEEVRGGSF
jgi:hypothetical protein